MEARELKGPSLAAEMGRDLLGWLIRRLLEAVAVVLALWVASLQSDSMVLRDYVGSAWGIGASAGLGWGLRTLSPPGSGWVAGFLRPMGILLIFVALFAAIFGMRTLPGFVLFLCS